MPICARIATIPATVMIDNAGNSHIFTRRPADPVR